MNLRDPVLYRMIGNNPNNPLPVPLYDFSHPIVDAVEGITHSICTLEFEDHRPLYDWVLNSLSPPISVKSPIFSIRPPTKQREFSRLNLQGAIMSKRKLNLLKTHSIVDEMDDPRLPTIRGIRRRGIPAKAIVEFVSGNGQVGISKADSTIEYSVFEDVIRVVMDRTCQRRFAVGSFDSDDEEIISLHLTSPPSPSPPSPITLTVSNHPKIDMGARLIHIDSGEILLSSKDVDKFATEPGSILKLKFGPAVTVTKVDRTAKTLFGSILSEDEFAAVKKKLPIVHWVTGGRDEQGGKCEVEIRCFDKLLKKEEDIDPADISSFDADTNFLATVNEKSKRVTSNVVVERNVIDEARSHLKRVASDPSKHFHSDLSYQFERVGYFSLDPDSTFDKLVFNNVVELRGEKRAKENKKIQESGVRKRGTNNNNNNNNNNNKKTTPSTPIAIADEVCRVSFVAATVSSISPHPSIPHLAVLEVDCGSSFPLQIVAALPNHSQRPGLVGNKVVIASNLKPAKLGGVESFGMLFAEARPSDDCQNGERILFEGIECEGTDPDECLKSKGAVKCAQRVIDRVVKDKSKWKKIVEWRDIDLE